MAHGQIVGRWLTMESVAKHYENSIIHPLSDSSWVVVTFGPLSKGQMSQYPFASDNLWIDEISL